MKRFVFLLLCSAGCSSPTIASEAADDAAPTNDAAREVESVTDTNGSPVDAAVGDATGSDDRIDPIAVGREWTYDVQVFGSYPGCSNGKSSGKVLRSGLYQGRHAFEIRSFCSGFGASWYAVEGDVVDLYYTAWLRVVDAPVVDGHSWTSGATKITWRKEPPVTTPAGTFDRCFRAEQAVGHPSYTIFCRGVGPVLWYTKDLSGNGYQAKLVSKNF